MRRRAAGLLLAALPVTTGHAAPPGRVYVVERVGDRIAPDAVVGPRRAGLACFPNGHVRWGDIGFGNQSDRRELVEDMLEDAGLPIATLSGGTSRRRQIRLRGVITDAAFDLCAKNMLGHAAEMSGTGKLVVEWRGETPDGDAPLHHVSTVEHLFTGKDAATPGGMGRTLLDAATRDLATWLQAPDGK